MFKGELLKDELSKDMGLSIPLLVIYSNVEMLQALLLCTLKSICFINSIHHD